MGELRVKFPCDTGLRIADKLACLSGLRCYSVKCLIREREDASSDESDRVCYCVRDLSKTNNPKPCIIVKGIGDGEYLIEFADKRGLGSDINGLAEKLKKFL